MYVRKRIGRRRSFFLKYRIPLFVFLCAAVCVLGFLLKPSPRIPISTNSPLALETTDSQRSPEPTQPVKYERPVYPYSVIPGGVRSRAELTSSIKEDPVVASHYSKFEVAEARFIKSEETQSVHVSYRIGDKIFWTAKTVAIPKGETLVTDGSITARTRCGNQVSVLPQEPISPEEPEIETFDIPVFETPLIARFEPPNLDFSKQPELGLDINPTQPVIPYVPIRPPALDNLRQSALRPLALFPRSSEVPEPGTIGLTILGLVTLAVLRFSRKK